MAFDLAEKLAAVSKLNTAAQPQIEYLPFALVDPDPDNFYSLERLDELADSIATVGLLDPIRVRPNGERYTITSGHRRRAAIQLLIDSGEEHWREALPCIVDRGEATAEFRELQLIYANSATRHLSSSELSRQAERVEALLVALKEQGYDFPGRMQEHVAQAMSVNASKLKRLHAIRSNAQEYVLDAYDKGEINESVAYELQKLDKGAQKLYMVQRRHDMLRLDIITAEEVAEFGRLASRLRMLVCKQTRDLYCSYSNVRLETALHRLNHTQRGNCTKGRCCSGCPEMMDCEELCPKCEHQRAELKEAASRRMMAAEENRKAREAQWRAKQQETARKNAEIWTRIRKAAEASGVDLRAALREVYGDVYDADTLEEQCDLVLAYMISEEEDSLGEAEKLLQDSGPRLAALLRCSLDYLFGLAETPTATPQSEEPTAPLAQGSPEAQTDAPAPWPTEWQTGTPDKEGWYAVYTSWHGSSFFREIFYWQDAWGESDGKPGLDKATKVLRWFPLPEVEE